MPLTPFCLVEVGLQFRWSFGGFFTQVFDQIHVLTRNWSNDTSRCSLNSNPTSTEPTGNKMVLMVLWRKIAQYFILFIFDYYFLFCHKITMIDQNWTTFTLSNSLNEWSRLLEFCERSVALEVRIFQWSFSTEVLSTALLKGLFTVSSASSYFIASSVDFLNWLPAISSAQDHFIIQSSSFGLKVHVKDKKPFHNEVTTPKRPWRKLHCSN